MSRTRNKIAVPTAIVASAALAFTTSPAAMATSEHDSDLPEEIADSFNVGELNRHLVAFERIAYQNDGNRAASTTGYDQSADYVTRNLEEAGFTVTHQEFPFTYFEAITEELASGGQDYDINIMRFSDSTPEGGLTAPTVAVPEDDTPGCEASDYDGIDVDGKIALIQRGECAFGVKQQLAADEGASAAVVYNNEEGELLGTLGEADAARIPTGGVSQADGADLVASEGQDATLELEAITEERTTHNVIAETRTGRTDNVVMAGAHLDSVPEGSGINDNGTGSAGLLQTALEMGSEPDVNNAIRFAWWGAEESGLVGSTHYVQELDFEEQLDIAMYLNFDMIGSPNGGYFVYDGDGDEFGLEGPYGSAQIEHDFVDRLNEQGQETGPTEISFRSDYAEFMTQGIPIGGLFTGAEGTKTEEEADTWGGQAGEAYDPCYHQECDHLGNVDRQMLVNNSEALAHVTASYGLSTEDVNGLPPGATMDQAERAAQRAEQRMATTANSGGDHAPAAA